MKRIKKLLTLAVFFNFLPGLAQAAQPLVSADWLEKNLNRSDIVIIDLRNKIDGGSAETFSQGHIPNAVHSDYLKDGWRVTRGGVIGLLPRPKQFEALAKKLGVSSSSHVVIVPAGVSATDFGSSARAYWTFKIFGHDKVSILDGGQGGWVSEKPGLIEKGVGKKPARGNFVARFNKNHYPTSKEIVAIIEEDKNVLLVDARPKEQYRGFEKHDKARISGHIPGATLISQSRAYDEGKNRLKTVDKLEGIYAEADGKPLVSYCNTGHWAATNWFVLSEILNREDVTLYDGSMVEWTSNEERPVRVENTNVDKIKHFFSDLI